MFAETCMSFSSKRIIYSQKLYVLIIYNPESIKKPYSRNQSKNTRHYNGKSIKYKMHIIFNSIYHHCFSNNLMQQTRN